MHASRRVRPAVLAIAFAAALPASGTAQDGAPAPVAPVHIDLVVVDAVGRPVTGLQSADIELRDAGAVQTIDAVTFVSPETAAAAGGEPAARIVGILLDEFHVDAANTALVRDAVERFIAREIRPTDLVVLVKPLDSLTRLAPSSGLDDLVDRIRTFEGRKGDYEPRTPLEETTMSRAASAAAPERARVVLSALAALTRRLGTLGDGRKALVFVSEGFLEPPQRGRLRGPGLPAIVESADAGDVAVYAIDPAVPAAAGAAPDAGGAEDPERQMLQVLASETGGARASAARIDEGLTAAARDLDGYYRVSYRPAHAIDGRHTIDVRVHRPEARVRIRAAHWAVPGRAAGPAGSASARPAPAPPRPRPQQISPLISTWFGMARGDDGRTRVTFTWEPSPRAPRSPAWLTLTAVGRDGQVLFERRVDPVRAIGLGGLPEFSAVFEAPPGLVQVDMTIRDAGGAMMGTDSRDVRLPDLHGTGTVLSTPAIIRTLSAYQFRTLSADPNAPPAVSRSFRRTERLIVRVHAYAADAGDGARPAVTARIVDLRNERLLDLRPLASAPADGMTQFDLPLASLSPGAYGLEIAAGTARHVVLLDVTN